LVGAIREINAEDNSFFRITEMHRSDRGPVTESNYPMLLGYYGTASYSSFNDSNYISFLDGVGMLRSRLEVDTRWTVGLTGNFLLSLFAGEKYVLTQQPELFQAATQYELVRASDNYSLLRNQFSLPLGLVFHKYLPQGQFLQLPQESKEEALLAAAILDDDSATQLAGLRKTTVAEIEIEFKASSYPAMVEQRKAQAFQLTSFSQSRLEGKTRSEQADLLVLQTPFNRGWQAFLDGRPAATVRADIGLLGVALDPGEHNVVLRYRNPWLLAGAVISGVALLLLAILRWRKPRLAQLFA
jgi:uncharacterized membrane protein YfhO